MTKEDKQNLKDRLLWAFCNVHSSDSDILGAYAHLSFDLLEDGAKPFSDKENDELLKAFIQLRKDMRKSGHRREAQDDS